MGIEIKFREAKEQTTKEALIGIVIAFSVLFGIGFTFVFFWWLIKYLNLI